MNAAVRGSSSKSRTVWLWIAAVLITLAALAYQWTIGPTRPVHGRARVGADVIRYRFNRSHGGKGDFPIALTVHDQAVTGYVEYRAFGTDDPWTRLELTRDGDRLRGALPHQAPGHKLAYRLLLTPSSNPADPSASPILIPAGDPVVVRFRGAVPWLVLGPHIALMFLGMLWSNRAGIEAAVGGRSLKLHARIALAFMVWGGLVFGPVVEWCSFGKAWTGVPFGWDLTDNKTLIAVLFWLAAWIAALRQRRAAPGSPTAPSRSVRLWAAGAAIVTLIVFSIPHSVGGDENQLSRTPAAAPAVR